MEKKWKGQKIYACSVCAFTTFDEKKWKEHEKKAHAKEAVLKASEAKKPATQVGEK